MTPIRIYNDANRFTIDWTLNTLCTYHCSYCPPSLHMGNNFFKSKKEDPEIIDRFLNNLAAEIKGRNVHMFINGGEPTISPVFEQIINFVDSQGWCAYVSTNGSRSLDWWQEYARKVYKITVSYHPETVVDEELFEKLEYMKTQTNVGVFVLMYPPLWDKCIAAYRRLEDMGITRGISRVFKRDSGQFSESYTYSDSQLAWMEENSRVIFNNDQSKPPPNDNYYGNTKIDYKNNEDIITENLDEVEFTNSRKNTFKGWTCYMGKEHIAIDGQGTVLQSTCSTAISLGTLENFTGLSPSFTVCRSDYCMCTLDVQIPKNKYKL